MSSTRKTSLAFRPAACAATLGLFCLTADAATAITIKAGNAAIAATLDDSPTAQDFVKSLPLTISMKRWGDREYYGKVRGPLSDRSTSSRTDTNCGACAEGRSLHSALR